MKILGVSGSLRKVSFNTALLHAAKDMMPKDSRLTVQTLHGIPLYNGDDEAENGVPEAVVNLQKLIAQSDGVLIASPEYNSSVPGVLKNAIDWVSRPSSEYKNVFAGKSVAVIGASPGGFGTILAQNAWLPVFRLLGADMWFGGRLMVSKADSVFNGNGQMIGDFYKEALKKFLNDFTNSIHLSNQPSEY